MFLIPGELISALTFPGVMLHEWAHKFFCERLGLSVYEVRYFQPKTPSGYVLHEQPKTYLQTFWISVGPLLVNSLAAVAISIVAVQLEFLGGFAGILFWFAFSAGMHAFPSDHDMEHIATASKAALKEGGGFLHYLAFPFVALVWVANKLRFFWFDVIYAGALISIVTGSNFFLTDHSTTVSHNNVNTNDIVVADQYRCSSYAANEASSIEPAQAMKDNIARQDSELSIQTATLDKMSAAIESDHVDLTDRADIDRHNHLIQTFNARQDSYFEAYALYKADFNEFKMQSDKYNAYLTKNCNPI